MHDREIIEYAALGYAAADREGRIVDWNLAAERLTGWSRVDALQQPLAKLLAAPAERALPELAWAELLASAVPPAHGHRCECAAARKDGRPATLELTAWVHEQDGQRRLHVLFDDISERRRQAQALDQIKTELSRRVAERTHELTQAKAEAEAASRAKSAFLATMSHEIRTPMNGIVGMIEVLGQSPLGEQDADAVRTIRDSALSLLGLLEDILDLSKIEADRLELERAPLSLPDLVETLCHGLLPVAKSKGVDINLFVDPELPEWIWGDPARLRQIITNLLSNAIKFSGGRPEQRGRVAIRLQRVEGSAERWRLAVSDNGVGMSADVLARLFSPFTQGEASTTRRFGGTGLGLTISKRLIDAMQGHIRVDSVAGAGSCFAVELPLDALPSDTPTSTQELLGVQCLLLHSEDIDPQDLAAYLRASGAEAELVVDLPQAAQRAAARSGTVVVLNACGHELLPPELLHQVFANAGNVRHVLIGRGRRRRLRQAAADIITADGDALSRRTLIRAVAAAAGRPSAEEADAGPPPAPRGGNAPSIAEMRAEGRLILIAEDDPINQKVILRQLALLGYAAEVADDGAQALRLWRSGQHALLLSDLHMPNMDGYALVAAIRREERGARPLPIIALTANALAGEAVRARQAGFDEYLTKPIQLPQLKAALDGWMPARHSSGPYSATAPTRDAASAPAAEAAVDIGVLRELIGDDEVAIRALLEDYLDSLRQQAHELLEAAQLGDGAHLSSIAHKLKSSSRSIGALALGDLCAELQNAGRTGDPRAIAQGLQQFERMAYAVGADIRRYLAG